MPRIYKSARGEAVDFDAVVIKQQLAQAPMNIEVARRKEFIDNKEEKPRRQQVVVPDGKISNETSISNEPVRKVVVPTDAEAIAAVVAGQKIVEKTATLAEDFDEGVPSVVAKPTDRTDGPIPELPKRK